MKKLYINVSDYQGTDWFIGETGTLKHWRELAMEWCDMDGNIELFNAFKYYKIKNECLIDYISEIWEIEIVEYDPSNNDHKELERRLYERV